jgi:large subunit ribosomal protein L25
MSNVKLDAQLRTDGGKGAARAMRRAGFVPGIIYGHGEETRACKVNAKELERLVTSVAHESTVIDLKLDDGDTPQVLIREIQVHPYRSEVLHVDFLAIRKGEKVKLSVPVHIIGVAPGIKEGGIMEHLRHEIEIRTIPSKIPEVLELDSSEMGIGDQLTVADIVVPDDVEILADASAAIAQVVPPTVHKVEEEEVEEVEGEVEEGVAEPELVGRGKAEEETAEEEK